MNTQRIRQERFTTIPDLARRNRAVVFSTLHEHAVLSRRAIVELSGLAEPTVSRIIRDLLNAGLATEEGLNVSTGGRRSTRLAVQPDARVLVGVEVSSESLVALAINLRAKVIYRVEHVLDARGNSAVTAAIIHIARNVLSAPELQARRVAGVGIAVPGPVDVSTGAVMDSVSLQLKDCPLHTYLEADLKTLVFVENDANAAATGERVFGAARQAKNMAYVDIGAGVGVGLVLDGKMYRGDHSAAGELGQTVIRVGDSVQTIDQLGSSTAFMKMGEHAITYAALAIANLVNLLDLNLIVVGGPALRSGLMTAEAISEFAYPYIYDRYRTGTRIIASSLGIDSVAIGAATAVLEQAIASGQL